jgi:hypothetical protein
MTANSGYEGWYTDPYAKHDARWMSQGSPTRLVRDGTVETYDDPPSGPYVRVPEPIESSRPSGADDLRRADEAEAGEPYDADDLRRADQAEAGGPYDADKARRAALDAFDETSGA